MQDKHDLFGEIQKIEREADEILSRAAAETLAIRRQAEEKVAELSRATDERIRTARSALAEEYRSKETAALAEIETQARSDERALDDLRVVRADDVVAWAASRILARLTDRQTHGD